MSLTGIHRIRLALAIAAAVAGQQAIAQSTASQISEGILEEVTVSGERVEEAGLFRKETVAKSRSTVGQEYFESQSAGQSVIQSINLVPGVSFVNNDPYGSSGGNIRLRGFDGNRIALLSDGIPLNDTGNYAVFTNQQLDSEIIDRVTVNLGTTDVDSPTAAATGGTINLVTNVPKEEMTGMVKLSWGEDDYRRYFVRGDSGEFGPWNTKLFVTYSDQEYDKFKGPGKLQKRQFNARIYQELGDNGDFLSLAIHGNRNRNAQIRQITARDLMNNGFGFDNDPSCVRLAPGPGRQNEGTACTNYFGVRLNPSDTANIRGQASIHLTDSLRWTFDPNFQYTLANGGGFAATPEDDSRLRGAQLATVPGIDLNGDGDTLDNVPLYAPNNTNTRRYGLTTSLIWEINDTNALLFGYTLDYGRHRQTGQFGPLDANGNPLSVFAGRDGPSILTADGTPLRRRDRFSVARLNQGSVSYATKFFDEKLGVQAGVRLPFFRRTLEQDCFTPLANRSGDPVCTKEAITGRNADGTVTLAGRGANRFIEPFRTKIKFDEVLPNLNLSFAASETQQYYFSYAKGFAAPRTDNLYPKVPDFDDVEGEDTSSFEVGYRYTAGPVLATVALWTTDVKNRIVSAFDPELNSQVDRNVGDVDMKGVDFQVGSQIFQGFSLYFSGSYIDTKILDNFPFDTTRLVPAKGKELVETPELTYSGRAEYRVGPFTLGFQGKFTDERFATDVNDASTPSYKVYDFDARYDFNAFGMKSYVQLNLNNAFDEEYLGNISSRIALTDFGGTPANPNFPQFTVGSPRTLQLSVETQF
jgi:iron complex outermembrane recepter protein